MITALQEAPCFEVAGTDEKGFIIFPWRTAGTGRKGKPSTLQPGRGCSKQIMGSCSTATLNRGYFLQMSRLGVERSFCEVRVLILFLPGRDEAGSYLRMADCTYIEESVRGLKSP